MNRRSSLLLCALLCAVIPVSAQRRRAAAKKPAVPAIELAQQAMDSYDFDRAVDILTQEIATLSKKKQDTSKHESMLTIATQARMKLHATESIVIIDSLVCSKDKALRTITLSRESGRIDTYASTYHTTDSPEATIYENELANKRYLALPTSTLRLTVSDKLGDTWSSPTLLTGLNVDDTAQNYPFLLSDGVTLYYAATGPESMGGYDIFVTRANGEDGSFFAPENVGFPFNSTANDYLLAIDEQAQLGWFITDRRQPEGKVCVYTFIPNDTRQTYGDDTSEARLRSLARLTSIRDTWSSASQGTLEAARQRLADLRTATTTTLDSGREFTFIIDDARTYTRLADFRSPIAREKMKQYTELSKATDTEATMLQRLRDNYATASAAQRQQLSKSILQLETTYYPHINQLRQLAKEIRNAEISTN